MSWLRPHAAPIAVAALTAVGLVLRLALIGDALFADELSTLWIVTTNDLGGVWSTVHTDAEITPPLFFVAAWLAARLHDAPEMTRLPSLLAGTATIPLIYLVGMRTVGRTAALTAAAVAALSPFMVFYSAEARSYALMILLVSLSTLSMLLALDRRGRGWWLVYAAASCAAMLTHYTAAFVLAAQLAWLLWAHPEARRPALIANAVAAIAFLPWLSGLLADFDSPTTEILSALSPFDLTQVRVSLTHAAVGYPFTVLGLRELPGLVPLALFAFGVALGVLGLVRTIRGKGPRAWLARLDPNMVLVVLLAFSVPVGALVVSAVGTNLFSTRNLAGSWPGYALCLGALLVAAGARWRLLAVGSVLVCLAAGALELTLSKDAQRPDFEAAARLIDERARPGDVLVDGAVLSPGPLSPLDVTLREPIETVRFQAPVQRARPFSVFDRSIPRDRTIRLAARRAGGNTLFVVTVPRAVRIERRLFPSSYRLVERRRFPGSTELLLEIWEPREL